MYAIFSIGWFVNYLTFCSHVPSMLIVPPFATGTMWARKGFLGLLSKRLLILLYIGTQNSDVLCRDRPCKNTAVWDLTCPMQILIILVVESQGIRSHQRQEYSSTCCHCVTALRFRGHVEHDRLCIIKNDYQRSSLIHAISNDDCRSLCSIRGAIVEGGMASI